MMKAMTLEMLQAMANEVQVTVPLEAGKFTGEFTRIDFIEKDTAMYMVAIFTVDGVERDFFLGSRVGYDILVKTAAIELGVPNTQFTTLIGKTLTFWVVERMNETLGRPFKNLHFKEPEAKDQVTDQVPVTTTRRPNAAQIK